MPRFSLVDALRTWVDPDVLGFTAMPLPRDLDESTNRCASCGASMVGATSGPADTCRLPPGIDLMLSLGDYDGPAGHAARLIKGACWPDGAWWWGSALGKRLVELGHRAVIVPVPGDRWRTLVRGIDHAARLAHAASWVSGAPCRALLARHDRTRQASRGARERRETSGRFAIKSKIHHVPEHVVLIDDVCTTGSTAADCAQAIRLAGATWVGLGVLARAHR